MSRAPDRVFADRDGMTWQLHVLRPDCARTIALAVQTGSRLRHPRPGLIFAAPTGDVAIFPIAPEWIPTAAQIADLTLADLRQLLDGAHHAPARDPAHEPNGPY